MDDDEDEDEREEDAEGIGVRNNGNERITGEEDDTESVSSWIVSAWIQSI